MVKIASHRSTEALASAVEALPASYRRWRLSRLGQVTDQLERHFILELCGTVSGLRALDVGCGDGDLAHALARLGADEAV